MYKTQEPEIKDEYFSENEKELIKRGRFDSEEKCRVLLSKYAETLSAEFNNKGLYIYSISLYSNCKRHAFSTKWNSDFVPAILFLEKKYNIKITNAMSHESSFTIFEYSVELPIFKNKVAIEIEVRKK